MKKRRDRNAKTDEDVSCFYRAVFFFFAMNTYEQACVEGTHFRIHLGFELNLKLLTSNNLQERNSCRSASEI